MTEDKKVTPATEEAAKPPVRPVDVYPLKYSAAHSSGAAGAFIHLPLPEPKPKG